MTDQTAAVWIDGDPLMEAIASAVWEQCRTDHPSSVVDDPRNIAAVAAAVARAHQAAELARAQAEAHQYRTALQGVARRAAVLPAPADRAAVLREAADVLDTLPADASSFDEAEHKYKGGAAAEKLRRMADEAQQPAMPDADTLAAALDGLHTLIATSSRDWQTYRVDAWLWAVLCGWDCEQSEHDDTCTHGALEETAAMHGWDDATVAKARRYRAAVRILTGPAVEAQQPRES